MHYLFTGAEIIPVDQEICLRDHFFKKTNELIYFLGIGETNLFLKDDSIEGARQAMKEIFIAMSKSEGNFTDISHLVLID